MKGVEGREGVRRRGGDPASPFPLHTLTSSRSLRLFTSSLPLLLTSLPAFACDACQKDQPAPLRGITHGTGPQNAWDMPIVWGAAVIVTFTLVLAVRLLVRPGERDRGHIKHTILNDAH